MLVVGDLFTFIKAFQTTSKSSKIVSMDKLPPFERSSIKQHQRERFWQIIAPLVLFSLLIAAAGGFTVFAGGENDRLWADISIIWLVIPVLIFSLILLVVLAGSIYLMARLLKITPNFTRRAQTLFYRIEKGTRKAADFSVKPVLWIKQFKSRLRDFMIYIKLEKKERS